MCDSLYHTQIPLSLAGDSEVFSHLHLMPTWMGVCFCHAVVIDQESYHCERWWIRLVGVRIWGSVCESALDPTLYLYLFYTNSAHPWLLRVNLCARATYTVDASLPAGVCDLRPEVGVRGPAALGLLREKGRRAEGGTLPQRRRAHSQRGGGRSATAGCALTNAATNAATTTAAGLRPPRSAGGRGPPTLRSTRPGGRPAACFRW